MLPYVSACQCLFRARCVAVELRISGRGAASGRSRRAVGIAAMNALAAFCWDRRPHPAVDLETDVDAFDAAAIAPDQMVVVVGAFVPFLRELKRRGNPISGPGTGPGSSLTGTSPI